MVHHSQATLVSGMLYAGLFANAQENFRHLLIQSHISNSRQEVLDMIARWLPSHMIVCNSTAAAVDLYQHAQLMPGESTRGHLITQHGVQVKGPLIPRCSWKDSSSCLFP